jgi:hypothetical protein
MILWPPLTSLDQLMPLGLGVLLAAVLLWLCRHE